MLKSTVSTLAIAVMGVGLVGFSVIEHPVPMIVWNASASVPVGLYDVVPGLPKRDDLVLVRAPNSVMALAERRGYLPADVPLVKRIAAVKGDRVCASNGTVSVDSVATARQLTADSKGRPLPFWRGCRELEQDEYFLLGDTPDSFDSRYFGPVKNDHVIGRLVPIWTE